MRNYIGYHPFEFQLEYLQQQEIIYILNGLRSNDSVLELFS
jgi:hypothetical protein